MYKIYKIRFSKKEKELLNTIERENVRLSTMSLYSYLIKLSMKDEENGGDGSLSFSYRPFLKKYNRSHKHIALGSIKKRLSLLSDLGLLTIIDGKPCTYIVNRMMNDDNEPKNPSNRGSQNNEKIHKDRNNSIILNTPNIVDELAKAYRGIEYSVKASKKQLSKIAKSLFVTLGLNSKSTHDKCVQWLVLKKLRFSNRKINLVGAINYIRAIIEEKLEEVKSSNFIVPIWLDDSIINNANFTQRDTDYLDIEEALLGW